MRGETQGSAMVISGGEMAIMLSAMTVFAAVGFVVYNRNISARQKPVRCVRENDEEELEEDDEDDPDHTIERDGVALASVIQPLFDLPNDDASLNLGQVFSYSSISPDLSPTSRRRKPHAGAEPTYDVLVSNNNNNNNNNINNSNNNNNNNTSNNNNNINGSVGIEDLNKCRRFQTCNPTLADVEDHDQDIRIFKDILDAAIKRDNNSKQDGANAYEMLQSWRPPKVKLQLSKENRDKIAALAIGRRERRTTLTVSTV